MVERTRGNPWPRRRFLAAGGAAAAAATGGAAWALTRNGSDPPPRAPDPTATAAPSVTPGPSAAPLPRGGVARLASPARFNFDTFDPLRTAERSVEEVLGRTNSRLVQWDDYQRATLAGDLASGWQQPDERTLILTITRHARWHDRPPLNGRLLTVVDVAADFQRLLDLRAAGQLSAPLAREFATLESVTEPGDGTVVLEATAPSPLLLPALASRFAMIAAPEAVQAFAATWHDLDAGSVVGTGPFAYDGYDAGADRFARHPGSHRPPHLDGVALYGPHGSGAAARDRFLSRELDAFLSRDRRDTATLRAEAAGARESLRLEDAPTITTVFAGAPPWSDVRLLRALNAALNRAQLIERLHAGQAVAAGPVTPASPAFALPEATLTAFAGYRTAAAQDAADARALWDAAGGPALGTITIDFPTIYDPIYSASSVVVDYLSEVLGPQFVADVRQYTAISARAIAREYGNGAPALWFGWGPPLDDPDPTRALADTYRTGAPGWQPFGMTVPRLDPVLDQLAAEFDLDGRAALAREASGLILAAGGAGVFSWLQQSASLFDWPYLHRPPPTPFWSGHLDAHAYLDPDGARPS